MRRRLEPLPWPDQIVVVVLTMALILATVEYAPDIPRWLGAVFCGVGAYAIYVVASLRVGRVRRRSGQRES